MHDRRERHPQSLWDPGADGRLTFAARGDGLDNPAGVACRGPSHTVDVVRHGIRRERGQVSVMGDAEGAARRWLRAFRLHRDASRAVVHLAYPVTLGLLSTTLLSAVDTAMLGRLGAAPLAASGVAGVLFFAIAFPLSAISVGVQALVARRLGEGRPTRCGEVLTAGLLLAGGLGIPVVCAAPWLAEVAAPILSSDATVALLGKQYLALRLLGTAFMLASMSLRGFFAGIGHTRQQMWAAVLTTLVNVLLDYVLIFGRWGFAPMGVEGAAIASTIALGAGAAYLAATSLQPKYRVTYALYRGVRAGAQRWGAVLRLSLPIVAQRLVSHGSWFAFFAVVARIGTVELAATNVMRSIYGLTVMPAVGFATAAATLVSRELGAVREARAERYAWEATRLSAYLLAAIGLLFVLLPRTILQVYTSEPAVLAAGALPLRLLGSVQAFGGAAIVLSHVLQGAGCTRYVLGVELAACFGLYLPLVFFLGLKTRLGLVGAWTGEYTYWVLVSLLMAVMVRRGTWKRVRI